MLAAGFGFVEVGTVTPLPQAGNPRPRLFRLSADGAIINRLGFNNEGHEAVAGRLEARPATNGIVGVNIGANRDSEDRAYDYVAGVRLFAPLASYLAINISSPNTPGLRDLQSRSHLVELLVRAGEARAQAAKESGRRTPLLVKVAPDLSEGELDDLIAVAVLSGHRRADRRQHDDVAAALRSRRHAGETGGLSGRPLFDLSTAMLARVRQLAGSELVLVGVGGVDSAAAAWSKFAAGADLVQLYTGLVYKGPTLPARIAAGLVQAARRARHRAYPGCARNRDRPLGRGLRPARLARLAKRQVGRAAAFGSRLRLVARGRASPATAIARPPACLRRMSACRGARPPAASTPRKRRHRWQSGRLPPGARQRSMRSRFSASDEAPLPVPRSSARGRGRAGRCGRARAAASQSRSSAASSLNSLTLRDAVAADRGRGLGKAVLERLDADEAAFADGATPDAAGARRRRSRSPGGWGRPARQTASASGRAAERVTSIRARQRRSSASRWRGLSVFPLRRPKNEPPPTSAWRRCYKRRVDRLDQVDALPGEAAVVFRLRGRNGRRRTVRP